MHRQALFGSLGVVLVSVLVAGCSSVPAPPHPAVPTPPSRYESQAPLGMPFDGQLPIVSLAAGLAQVPHRVSLPSATVAGVADVVVIDHHANSNNGLFIHYSTGIFLAVEPFPVTPSQFANMSSSDVTHADGSRYLSVETIRGRETAVATKGPLFQGGRQLHGDGVDVLNWNEGGMHYMLKAFGQHPASLDLLRQVAGAMP